MCDEDSSNKKVEERQGSLDEVDFLIRDWSLYFSGKSPSPKVFLRRLHESKINQLSVDAIERLSALIVDENRIHRLISLLQVLMLETVEEKKYVLTIAEAVLLRIDTMLLPESGEDYSGGYLRWWCKKQTTPLDRANLEVFFCALLYAWISNQLDDESIGPILCGALLRNPESINSGLESPIQNLLSFPPRAEKLVSVLKQYNLGEKAAQRHMDTIRGQKKAIERLESVELENTREIARLSSLVNDLESKVSSYRLQILESEKKNDQIHNTYRYQLDQTKSRMRGFLGGNLRTWISTSLDAIRATPPRIPVAEQRLEDIRDAVERECQCLQHLD